MALSFPNKSRAFDATRRAVRFWGHDSAMEVAFFVTEDALKRVEPHMHFDEAGFLRAFDSNRDRICATAAKVYARRRRHVCIRSSTRKGPSHADLHFQVGNEEGIAGVRGRPRGQQAAAEPWSLDRHRR